MVPGQDAVTLSRQLQADGFAVARNHVGPNIIDALRSETRELLDGFADGHRSEDYWSYEDAETGSAMLYRVHNLERQGAVRCAGLLADGPLHDLAAALIGPVNATVCAMVVKTPGVAGVPWHRDRTDVTPTSAINLSLFLDRSTVDNGCFEAVPGSHLLPDDADVIRTRDLGQIVSVPADRGDVLIHDVRLVHGSGDNPSNVLRRSVIVEFVNSPRSPQIPLSDEVALSDEHNG